MRLYSIRIRSPVIRAETVGVLRNIVPFRHYLHTKWPKLRAPDQRQTALRFSALPSMQSAP